MQLIIMLMKTGLLYFMIISTYKLMNKKKISDLSTMDLAVFLLLSNIIALNLSKEDQSYLFLTIIIAFIITLQVVMTYLSSFIPSIKYMFNVKPTIIIKKGRLDFKELLKRQYNLDDLLKQLREKSIKNIEDVEYAVLENNGTLSVFGQKKGEEDVPLPIIIDGKIQYATLKILNKSVKWIENIMEKEEILLDNVFYAFYQRGKFYVIKNE